MKDSERQTRTHLMQLFADQGIHPRNDLGQNFLIDLNIVEFIVEHAELGPNDVVLEVGAGTGGMTIFLAQQADHVVSVELDQTLHAMAATQIAKYENVTLLRTDALKNKNRLSEQVLSEVKQQLEVSPERRLKLISNLPYSVATPVISNLVVTDLPWSRMVVTIQLELGQRMSAKPRTSHYGALSVWLQSQCHVKILRKLGPTVFWPRPKVNSAIVEITPDRRRRKKINDRTFFHDFIRRLFHHRRKLLRSVVVGMYRKQLSKSEVDDLLLKLEVKPTARAEELSVGQLVHLANEMQKCILKKEQAEQI